MYILGEKTKKLNFWIFQIKGIFSTLAKEAKNGRIISKLSTLLQQVNRSHTPKVLSNIPKIKNLRVLIIRIYPKMSKTANIEHVFPMFDMAEIFSIVSFLGLSVAPLCNFLAPFYGD